MESLFLYFQLYILTIFAISNYEYSSELYWMIYQYFYLITNSYFEWNLTSTQLLWRVEVIEQFIYTTDFNEKYNF